MSVSVVITNYLFDYQHAITFFLSQTFLVSSCLFLCFSQAFILLLFSLFFLKLCSTSLILLYHFIYLSIYKVFPPPRYSSFLYVFLELLSNSLTLYIFILSFLKDFYPPHFSLCLSLAFVRLLETFFRLVYFIFNSQSLYTLYIFYEYLYLTFSSNYPAQY